RDVGVAPSAVYNHFKNLDALLESVAADGHRQVAEIQARTYTGRGKPDVRLRALARQYLHFAADNPELYRLMFRPRPPHLDPDSELHQASDTTFRFLVEWWHGEGSYDATKSAILYPRALAVWSMLHGGAMEIIDKQVTTGPDESTSINRLAEVLLDALLDGVRQHLPKKT
ncbi:MAG: AcrR family transcriptional regulator, partial [Halieaceae bacterium]